MNDPLYDRRVDLENSGSAPGGAKDINLLDLVLGGFKAAFNTSCKPVTKVCWIANMDDQVRTAGCGTVVDDSGGPPGVRTVTGTVANGCVANAVATVDARIWNRGTDPDDKIQGTVTCAPPGGPTVSTGWIGPTAANAGAVGTAAGAMECKAEFDNQAAIPSYMGIVRCVDP
jgi:hypothetical protein